ncbi:hypothetical protein KDH_77030 [Dictyobacter sp. S3.2.2.5]|uniref:Integral membrane bound transporter domain-containing protein n=1 Tax=Dictyobacter halimunensis TaxID=3026934 RepID=A0ABQ6G2Z5_9CHLR|nr:hypothetical protein KDH_77030 [Dictyobacter sp. S3.2.2.5]
MWQERGPFLLFAAKSALAAGGSWAIAFALLGVEAAALAVVSSVIVVQVTSWQTVRKSIERILGVLFGIFLAVGVAHFFGLTFWTITLIIFLAQIVGLLLQKRGQYLATQIPISAALVLALGATANNYPLLRLLGAVVGGLVGTIVSLLLSPPVYVSRTQDALEELLARLAGALPTLADALAGRLSADEIRDIYPSMRKGEQWVRAAEQAYTLGVDSTRLNPWAHRARGLLVDYPDMLLALDRMTRQMRRIGYILATSEPAWSELAPQQSWAFDYASLLRDIGVLLTDLSTDLSSSNDESLKLDDLRARLEDAQWRLQNWQAQLERDAQSGEVPAEGQRLSTGSMLVMRGAILTDLRHMLAEVHDLIDAAYHDETRSVL